MRELRGEEGERGDSLPATFSASSSANRRKRSVLKTNGDEKSNAPMDESDLAMASLMMDMVFSKLLLLVEGEVLVVPNELCLPCPFLNLAEAFSETGLCIPSAPGLPGVIELLASFISVDPLGLGLLASGEEGAVEASNESPSSSESREDAKSSGSMRSGGRCSLSISDLRASIKLVMDSLMPSAPLARAP